MEMLLRDLSHGLRLLRKAPGLATLMILTLVLGIGANTAMFSVVDGILLDPLPYRDPDQLVRIWETAPARGEERGPVSPANLADWRSRSRSFTSIAASSAGYFNLAGRGEPRRVIGAPVTANLFTTLGVAPFLGRTFTAEEEQAGRERVLVLSHRLWRSGFSADRAVVGTTVRIEGTPYTIVGVMPPGFYFPDPRFELWLPLVLDTSEVSRSSHMLQVIARRHPRVGMPRASNEMQAIARALAREHPHTNGERGVRLTALHEETVGAVRPLLLVLMAAAGFVLLIACVNAAHLLLTRAIERQREMAIRVALGAGRRSLVRQTLAESTVLALLAGAAGWLLARWGVAIVVRLAPPSIPRLEEIRPDASVLAFTLSLSILTGLLFGSAPALQSVRRERFGALSGSAGGGTSLGPPRGARATRFLLVTAEVAMTFVLVVGAGVMIRSFLSLATVDAGFRTENRLAMDVSLPSSRYREIPEIVAVYHRILAGIEALPGVEKAALVSNLPLSGGWTTRSLVITDRADQAPHEPTNTDYRLVSAAYFETLGIPMRRGRPLKPGVGAEGAGAVLVNESMARQFWPGGDPVGSRVSFSGQEGPWLTVVGVVGDVRHYGLAGEPRPEVYEPYERMPWPWQTVSLVVHTRGAPAAMLDAVRRRVREIDSDLPIDNAYPLAHLISAAAAGTRFSMVLLGVLAGVALVLATGGIYGVMSQVVGQRRREISTRVALGARPAEVVRMILAQSLSWVIAGIAAGVLLAIALQRFLTSLVFGVSTLDVATLATVTGLLLGVAATACYFPARAGAGAEPMAVLRAE